MANEDATVEEKIKKKILELGKDLDRLNEIRGKDSPLGLNEHGRYKRTETMVWIEFLKSLLV